MQSDFHKKLIKDLADYEYDLNDEFKNRHITYEVFDKIQIYKIIKSLIIDVRDMRKCLHLLNG